MLILSVLKACFECWQRLADLCTMEIVLSDTVFETWLYIYIYIDKFAPESLDPGNGKPADPEYLSDLSTSQT